MPVIRKLQDCAFIVTSFGTYSCVAKQDTDGRIYAIAECEDRPTVIVQALSEETAISRLGQKLNGIVFYI